MKHWMIAVAGLLVVAMAAGVAWTGDAEDAAPRGARRVGPATRPGARQGAGLGARGGGLAAGDLPPRRLGPPPLMVALDADRDGELSAKEIAGAVAALKKLDRNGDGKLDRQELLPRRPGAAGRRPSPEQFVDHVMRNDRNGDGKVTRQEMPEPMRGLLGRVDTSGDGAIDKAEAEAFAKHLAERRDAPRRRSEGRGEGPARREERRGRREERPPDSD